MDNASDLYQDTALVYIELVRKISLEAAEAIEHIHATLGSHAALRSALIIVLMEMEVRQHHWLPHVGIYQHLMDDYPEARPFAVRAMDACLKAWDIVNPLSGNWLELSELAPHLSSESPPGTLPPFM